LDIILRTKSGIQGLDFGNLYCRIRIARKCIPVFFLLILLASCTNFIHRSSIEPVDSSALPTENNNTPSRNSLPTNTAAALTGGTRPNLEDSSFSLLAYADQRGTGFGGYWELKTGSPSARDVLIATDTREYCCLIQNHMGAQIAFVQRKLPEIQDSIWVMNSDGSSRIQIGDETSASQLAPGATEYIPIGFSPSGDSVLALGNQFIEVLGISDKHPQFIERPRGVYLGYSQSAGKLIFYAEASSPRQFILLDAVNSESSVIFPLPQDTGFDYQPWEQQFATLSPDSMYLLISSFDRDALKEELWFIDTQTGRWQSIIAQEYKWASHIVVWSEDGRYIAWVNIFKDIRAHYFLFLHIVDIQEHKVVRSDSEEFINQAPILVGWVDYKDHPRFGAYLPGIGIQLFDASSPLDDHLLFSYARLDDLLPVDPNNIEFWEWIFES